MIIGPSTVSEVQFYPLGDDDVLENTNGETLTSGLFRNFKPIAGGVYDAHFGTTEHSWRCLTCLNPKMHCDGHFGHRSLNYPVQSPMFGVDIVQWLKIICFECGQVIIDKLSSLESIPKPKRLGEYVKLTRNTEKNIRCVNCKTLHPHIARDKNRPVTIWAEFYNGNKMEKRYQLFNHISADIFDRISNETVELMGKNAMAHPRKFLLSYMSMTPNTLRPDIKKIGGGRSNNNDQTTLLKTMVEIDKGLPAIIPEEISDTHEVDYTNLDMTYHELVKGTPGSSGKNKVTTNTNRPPGSLASRFPQKPGRIRRNLMGCRVWYCARSVITCDPNLKVDEIGIPKDVATEIQIPEIVTARNRSRLMIYFNNKRDIYPGCTKVLKKRTGVEHWVGSSNRDFVLEDGDVIMRDLIDGDVSIFNRQPSLLGPSMSCHKVIVLNRGKTIRMNISACVLYNADFDGDAMNLFFARSIQARNEIYTLANVGVNFMSKNSGKPLIGCFQDTLASVVELTKADVRVSRYNAMELFKNFPVPLTKDTYTGRELMSMLLPAINFRTKGLFYNKAYAPYLKYKQEDIEVQIGRGKLVNGIMDHKSVGQSRNNSIFHTIHNEYGPKAALDTLFNIQQVVMEFIYNRGFTVGMDDLTISDDALASIHDKTSALIMESGRITEKLKSGEIIPPIGMTIANFYERQQVESLALGDDFVEAILSNINTEHSGLYKMITMCKKGSMKNFQAITSAIGSTLINGNRANTNFGYNRTLPYYTRYDMNPIANGFVPDSFMTGIRPDSFLFMAQEARFGVINKALSTSITGAQNREAIKNLESIETNNFRQSVKHTTVIQYIYGNNGVDVRRVENVNIPTIMISMRDMTRYHTKATAFSKKYRNDGLQTVLDAEYAQLEADRNEFRRVFLAVETIHPGETLSGNIESPVNVKRIVDDIVYDFRDADKGEIDPGTALSEIKEFCENLPYIYLNSIQQKNQYRIPPRYHYALRTTIMLIRSYLTSSVMLERKINNAMLRIIMDKIRVTASKALIDYGSAVGILAAQSLSEPFTQHIIDSHHRSGVSGSDDEQTDKLTRSKELMLAKITEKMKNPTMVLYVKEAYEDNSIKVNEIANYIENMRLYRFINTLQIFFEEYKKPMHPGYAHEKKMIDSFENHNPNVTVPTDLTPWVIRMELNKLKMILKNMDLETIIFGIIKTFPDLFVVYNSENADTIVIRCYVRNTMFKRNQSVKESDILALKDKIIGTVVRGVNGIRDVSVVKRIKSVIADDGSVKTKPIYIIKTRGTNLSAILENPYLDIDNCQTDSIKEIEHIYGIEAARQKLRVEIEKLIPGLNQAHYSVYSDEMCSTGKVTGISKPGLDKRENTNVLLRTSYNFMTQVLKTAATDCKLSEIYGMSAPLMLGRSPYIGSTYNSVSVDYDFVSSNVKNIQDILDDL
jgi:DNA-directed RNA polymerase beta' subunit